MPTSLDPSLVASVLGTLTAANRAFEAAYPGEPATRQPLHTVYGGGQLFSSDTTVKLGQLAMRALDTYAPDAATLAEALALPGDAELHQVVYDRVVAKLEREPVEDFRIDFEDGFGNRPDDEEDMHAERAAREVAKGMREGTLPPFIGIRIKPFTEELKARSARTLDIFVSTLLAETGGQLPENFVITLPKVPIPEQVDAFVVLLDALEQAHGLDHGTLKMEFMVELTQTILGEGGYSPLPSILRACQGRCTGAHFGTYDYTASAQITAAHQVMDHPACDFAKHVMKNTLAGTGVFLSDGATNVMPVGPHKGELTEAQAAENRAVVHGAWRLASSHIRHSLEGGFFQGWDLHPAQLPVRYATCFAFYLEGHAAASERLKNFIDKAAQATLVGDVFDDAATGQGLLNTFLRALNSGAITLDEVAETGLTLEEIQSRSFVQILKGRRKI
ncbi:MAG: phosphoenolpyruvate kinase [Deltaproteobacteria bacterium]|nr:MAG: phosphoenolpyruvate kinase [Deltaproteobacteria bacterium]